MTIEFDEGYAEGGESYKELRMRARKLLNNCHKDTFGEPPLPIGWTDEAPLYIDRLLGEVINLKNQATPVGEIVDDETQAEDIRWPQDIAEKGDCFVHLFGLLKRLRTEEERENARTDAKKEAQSEHRELTEAELEELNTRLDEEEIVSNERLTPVLARLPGTPQGLVDMYEAYVHGISDLEEYWEDTWDDIDFETMVDESNQVETLDLEEIKQITKEVAKEITDELAAGAKGTMKIRELQIMVSDLDDSFDESVVKEERLHEKIDRLATIKFTRWLRNIPLGPSTHFDKITKAVTNFPFSPESSTRADLLQLIRKKARISAHRWKIDRRK